LQFRSEPVPLPQQRRGSGGDHSKATNPLVEFSLRDSRVTPESRIADVIHTALDRPLPHLAFLDLSMCGAQHLSLRSTWTQHTGLKALSLLGSQWIRQHPEGAFPGNRLPYFLFCLVTMQRCSPWNAADPKPPITLSRLRVERPDYLHYNSPNVRHPYPFSWSTSNKNHTTTTKDEWSWSALFGRLAATLTELELVRHVRDPHQIATLAALFPHAPLDPTHGDT
jgi:hypothetical protein